MMEATHFIADNFTRTRNMLEAIASGKPVVTTQWLESIDQVNIYVDEDLYILRDSKKEKEFCFNMGVSLARARQFPLLQVSRLFVSIPFFKPRMFSLSAHYFYTTSGEKSFYHPKYKAWFKHNHDFG